MTQTKTTPYSQARRQIRDGDVLLFCNGNVLIVISGRSPFTHAGMAVWWGDDLMCVHTVQGRGGVVDHLSELVAKYPGKIAVYRVCEAARRRYSRAKAVAEMKRIIGLPYGWPAILTAACLHLPIVRWFVRPLRSDEANGGLPFCSAAVSRASRAGGLDPVPNLADKFTEPGDLARSAAMKPRFVLIPDNWEDKAMAKESVSKRAKEIVETGRKPEKTSGWDWALVSFALTLFLGGIVAALAVTLGKCTGWF